MKEYKVPVQSLIDHIKTAIDVDPWAKEMAEELLKEQKQIVRCKDCKHRGIVEKCLLAAVSEEKDVPIFILDNRGEWFCADGELRE